VTIFRVNNDAASNPEGMFYRPPATIESILAHTKGAVLKGVFTDNFSGLTMRGNYRVAESAFGLGNLSGKISAVDINAISDPLEPAKSLTLLASNDIVPVTFGRDRFYVKPFVVASPSNELYVAYLVGEGEIAEYLNIYVDGIEINAVDGFLSVVGAEVNTYVGDLVQTVDPLLVEALAPFTEAFLGYAYLVIKVPNGTGSGFPRVEVEILGKKIIRYDLSTPLEKTVGGVGARNVVHDACDASLWTASGATITDQGTTIGDLKRVAIASNGATTDDAIIPITSPGVAFYAVTLYVAAGTSGRISLDIDSNGTTSTASGVLGALAVTDQSAGTYIIFRQYDLGDYWVINLVYAPTVPADTQTFYLGPDSAVVGETIFAYAAQIEDSTSTQTSTPEATSNPVNIAAYMMSDMGKWTVNDTYAQLAAVWNNELLPADSSPRREMGVTFSKVSKLSKTIEYLRAYTGCDFAWADGEVYFIQNVTRDTVHTFDGDNIESISLSKKKASNMPTVVKVEYTDVNNDYAKAEVTIKAAGVDAGTTPRRIARVNMIGVHHHNVARREATARVNERLSDLFAEIEVFDEALAAQIGDVCSVTHPIGLTAKLMSVTGIRQKKDSGLWTLSLAEYDPLLYSSDVESEPTYADTNLAPHTKPPAIEVSSLILTEQIYKRRNGEWDNRVQISWDASVSPYTRSYVVRVKQVGVVIFSTEVPDLNTAYGPLEEDVTYTIEVVAVTSLFQSDAASKTFTPLGKQLIPPDVTGFTGTEIGGTVRLAWAEAVDLDITGYEIRYGLVGTIWANAAVLNVVDSLRYETPEVPPGTWDMLIKARDSVGQESVNATVLSSLIVTLDNDAFLAGNKEPFLGGRNLLQSTEEFNEAIWVKTNCTITADQVVGPFGFNIAADQLIEASDVTQLHSVNQTTSAFTTVGDTVVVSCFVKAGPSADRYLAFSGLGLGATGVVFNGGTGVHQINGTWDYAGAVSYGNGWYRCWATGSILSVGDLYIVIRDSYAGTDHSGNGTSSLYIYGAMLERGTIPTPYVTGYEDTTEMSQIYSIEEVKGSNVIEHYTDSRESWDTMFGSTVLTSFPNALVSYQTVTGDSIFWSEVLKLPADNSGSWQGSSTWTDYVGTAAQQLWLKEDGGSWTSGIMSRKESAQSAQLDVRVTAGVFKVTTPQGKLRADVQVRKEYGAGISSATLATTITLENSYAAFRNITITPEGSTSKTGIYDAVVVGTGTNTFDVYIFDGLNNQILSNFVWEWAGV
jgi:hypothetical protein